MVTDLVGEVGYLSLEPKQFLGIPIALVGAMFLSVGAQLQHHGVAKVEKSQVATGGKNLSFGQMRLLLARPSWVVGTLMLGLAVVFQLTSLYLSPIIVVQPLGAVALVVTAVLNARVSKVALNRRSVVAVSLCVAGVGAFVLLAAFFAREMPVTDTDLIEILAILGAVLVAFVVCFWLLRNRFRALIYIVGAGILYGFVATLAKVTIARISQGTVDWLLALCIIGILLAAIAGGYFVQNAYSSGPPDLVIAGLTVIDPMVAVTVGIVILGEAAQAPLWVLICFVITGAAAVYGVFMLSKYHPQASDDAVVDAVASQAATVADAVGGNGAAVADAVRDDGAPTADAVRDDDSRSTPANPGDRDRPGLH